MSNLVQIPILEIVRNHVLNFHVILFTEATWYYSTNKQILFLGSFWYIFCIFLTRNKIVMNLQSFDSFLEFNWHGIRFVPRQTLARGHWLVGLYSRSDATQALTESRALTGLAHRRRSPEKVLQGSKGYVALLGQTTGVRRTIWWLHSHLLVTEVTPANSSAAASSDQLTNVAYWGF
jgi:hypothetical protein